MENIPPLGVQRPHVLDETKFVLIKTCGRFLLNSKTFFKICNLQLANLLHKYKSFTITDFFLYSVFRFK